MRILASRSRLIQSLILSAAVLGGCEPTTTAPKDTRAAAPPPVNEAVADTIYSGGPILTMEGDSPQYVEALAVTDGLITYTGSLADARGQVGESTRQVDLDGRALLPGFVDAHGHVWNTGVQALTANLLPPPDGDGRDIDTLVNVTREWAAGNADVIEATGWIIGFGYDDVQLAEGRHPTADDLDRVSDTVPVLFLHQSTHLGVMNHKGLEKAGYFADTPNPAGGVIQRDADGRTPTGVLEEMALFAPLFAMLAEFDQDTNLAVARAGMAAYAAQGFTTAQEGRATKSIAEAWRTLAERGELILDVDVYPDIAGEEAYLESVGTSRDYDNGFRIAGAKLSLDGAIQNFTGWLSEPYHQPPAAQDDNYNGYPAFAEDAAMTRLVDLAYQRDWQLIVHSNGDAAADQLIAAVDSAVEQHGPGDRRTVMIHAQTVREDQLDAMQALEIFPSFFAMHTYYWGDLHRDTTLGRERAFRISPARSALDRGMTFSQHHDAPVALPSAMAVLSAAVNRTSRSGDVIGPEQRISTYDALRAITTWAAWQGYQETRKGSLEVGKLADLVILDRDPLDIEPEALRELNVMETIKQGKTIYTAGDGNDTGTAVSGTAMYRERIALPPGAEFEATLEDVSRADAPANVLGRVRFEAPSGPPITFEIPYDADQVDDRFRYAVRARIEHQGNLLFTTDTHYPVLTQDAPGSVEIMLKRVAAMSPSDASLENTYWKVMSIRGEPVTVAERQREPHVILHPDDKRVSGHGGCNSLVGGYEVRGDQVRFLRMAGTMMACPEGMEQEQALHQALGEVVRWKVDAEQLQLLDNEDNVILELESRYME